MGGAGQDFCEDFERRESIYVLWTAIPNPKTTGWGAVACPWLKNKNNNKNNNKNKNKNKTHQLRTKLNCRPFRFAPRRLP